MQFSYQARDLNGAKQSGTLEASSKEVALEILSQNKLFPFDIKEVKEGAKNGASLDMKIHLFEGVSMKDVAIFSRQLSIMIDSNVPPAEAIEALGKQTKKNYFREKIFKIADDVRGGTVLSKAFGKYPNIFSIFYVNMLKSGEVSGNLPKILSKVADHLESEYAIRSKTLGAMIYPAVILVIFVIIFAVMMIFVIPGLVKVLKSTGQTLPLATTIIIAISDFTVNYWYLLLLFVIAAIVFFVYYPKTVQGKEVTDRLVLKLPIIGGFLKNLFIMRLAENFSTLTSAGVAINEALEVVSDLIGNNIYKRALLEIKEKVIKGQSVSIAFSEYPQIISPLFVQLASVGEQTGKLDTSLLNVVSFYKRETDVFIDSLSSIIEPVLIIGLALMVGFLVAAVLLPIYQISTTIPQ